MFSLKEMGGANRFRNHLSLENQKWKGDARRISFVCSTLVFQDTFLRRPLGLPTHLHKVF